MSQGGTRSRGPGFMSHVVPWKAFLHMAHTISSYRELELNHVGFCLTFSLADRARQKTRTIQFRLALNVRRTTPDFGYCFPKWSAEWSERWAKESLIDQRLRLARLPNSVVSIVVMTHLCLDGNLWWKTNHKQIGSYCSTSLVRCTYTTKRCTACHAVAWVR